MHSNFKIIVLFSVMFSFAARASQSNTPVSSNEMTPVTPHSPLRRISSTLGFSEQENWQKKLVRNISKKFICKSCKENQMQILGNFKVDEKYWHVVTDPKKSEWKFLINIHALPNEIYELTITNPNIKYFNFVNATLKPNQTWTLKTNDVSHQISELLKILDPESCIYGE